MLTASSYTACRGFWNLMYADGSPVPRWKCCRSRAMRAGFKVEAFDGPLLSSLMFANASDRIFLFLLGVLFDWLSGARLGCLGRDLVVTITKETGRFSRSIDQ